MQGYGVNTGGKGLWSQYKKEGVMELIKEGRGYGVNTSYGVNTGGKGLWSQCRIEGRGFVVNTGGKGLWSQYRREGVMESIQEGVMKSVQERRGYIKLMGL